MILWNLLYDYLFYHLKFYCLCCLEYYCLIFVLFANDCDCDGGDDCHWLFVGLNFWLKKSLEVYS